MFVCHQPTAGISAGGTAAWYLPDRLGSIRDLTDASGAVQDHVDYTGFGKVTSESNPSFGDRVKYTGRELDGETGLQLHGLRYYDPETGRWTTLDPIVFGAGDPNRKRPADHVLDMTIIFGGSPDPLEFVHVRPHC